MREKFTAVALKYVKETGFPVVLLRGSGTIALRIVALAKHHNIALVEDGFLVSALKNVNEGSSVPEKYWQVLAELFVHIGKAEELYEKSND